MIWIALCQRSLRKLSESVVGPSLVILKLSWIYDDMTGKELQKKKRLYQEKDYHGVPWILLSVTLVTSYCYSKRNIFKENHVQNAV